MVLSGDFRHILPVMPTGSKYKIILFCFKLLKFNECFTTLKISENMMLKSLREKPNADKESLRYPDLLLKFPYDRGICTEYVEC